MSIETPTKQDITFNVDGKIVRVPLSTIMEEVEKYTASQLEAIKTSNDDLMKTGLIWLKGALVAGGPILLKMGGYKEKIRPQKGDDIIMWYMGKLLIKMLEPIARIPEIKVKADE